MELRITETERQTGRHS